jgi:predicted RNase H-like HicB family nuclease
MNRKGKEQRKSAAEITLTVERDADSGWFVASWDAPRKQGGITTQGKTLRELEQNVREAVACHFDNGKRPERIRLHFVEDPVIATA